MVLGTTLRDGDSSGVAVTIGGGRGDGQTLLAIWPLFLTLLQSSRFSCLGSDWDLTLRFTRFRSTATLGYRSSASAKVTFAILIKNHVTEYPAITEAFDCDKQTAMRVCLEENLFKFISCRVHGALVVDVLMKPAGYPFHAFIPVNPSTCKTVQDLFNDKELADIVFEVGGANENDQGCENENKPLAFVNQILCSSYHYSEGCPIAC